MITSTCHNPYCSDDFVNSLWVSHDLRSASFLHHLETLAKEKPFARNTVRHATSLLAISSHNPYYNNLRVLAKSLKYSVQSGSPHRWVIWHLEILKQCHRKLRNDIRKISSDLREISKQTHTSLIHIYFEKANGSSGKIDFANAAGDTPFAIYRSIFWDNAKRQYDVLKNETSSETNEKHEVWGDHLADYNVMDFVIQLSLFNFPLGKEMPQSISAMEKALGNFSYELANY